MKLDERIMTGAVAAHRRGVWKAEGKRVVFTNGCFDILHAGHVSLLEAARSEGDILLVGLNDDASVRRLKGAARPINPERDRALVLAALRSVDGVIQFAEDTPLNLIELLRPDVLVKGGDYTEATIVGAEVVKGNGGMVRIIPLVEGRATTNVVEKIRTAR
jgi:D-beta-D-heptose 7-phosphate kinase/D-beta-D-heptose 1-phosphate adenosyltransferase